METISQLWESFDLLSYGLGVATGGIGGLSLFRYRRSKTNIGGNQSNQRNLNVEGDTAGRDINKK